MFYDHHELSFDVTARHGFAVPHRVDVKQNLGHSCRLSDPARPIDRQIEHLLSE